MKKNHLLMAAFATLAFTACTNDDDLGNFQQEPIVSTEVVEGATFEINVAGAANGTTKNARPMGSSAADNNVNVIMLKIYKYVGEATNAWQQVTLEQDADELTEGNLALKYVSGEANMNEGDFLNLSNGSAMIVYKPDVEEGVPGNDRHINKRAKIEVVGLQSGTKYQIVATGYNAQSPYNFPYTNGGNPAGTGFQNGVSLAGVGSTAVEEIFAATATADTYTNGGSLEDTSDDFVEFTVTPSLTLTRQVAGILAYFKDVPMFLPKQEDVTDANALYRVEKLEIVANQTATDFYFPASLLDDSDFNGVVKDENKKNVLMTFDFSTATNYPTSSATINASDITGGSYTFYTFKNNTDQKPNLYANDYTAPEDLQLLENTIFGAKYILPYDKHYGESTTLTLRFIAKENGTDDEFTLQERDVTTDQPGFASNTYDIRCNNFYSIGRKLATDDTNGPDGEKDPDPDDPDGDDDDPISLRGNTVSLRINDAWAVLHNMGIE